MGATFSGRPPAAGPRYVFRATVTLLVQPLAERFQKWDRIPLSDRTAFFGRETKTPPLDLVELPDPSQGMVGG